MIPLKSTNYWNQGYFHRRSPIFPVKRHTASSVRSKRLPYRFHGTRYRNQGTSVAHICQLWLSPHTRYRAGHHRPDHPHGLSQPWNRVCTLFFRGKQPDLCLCLSAEYRRSDSQTLHQHCCKQRIPIICGCWENGGSAGSNMTSIGTEMDWMVQGVNDGTRTFLFL